MQLKLEGKTAFVSGSERGTGEVIAQRLLQEGANVVFHSNDDSAYSSLNKNIELYGEKAFAVWGDVRADEGSDRVVDAVREQGLSIDILINNYGTGAFGTWDDTDSDSWLAMYQTNVLSAMRLSRAFYSEMKTRGWGRIVNLGTIGSHQPNSIMPHYYAAKGALATASVSLAKELAHTGITVNTVSPGLIHTEEVEAAFRKRAAKKGWGNDWDEIVQQMTKHDYPNPCGRIATRQEVADLVAFISSPLAGYINGQNIRIDGGAVSYV